MGFDLEKRLANELNRLTDEASHDAPRPQQVERLKQLAAEIKDRLLGMQQSEEAPGKRTASMDEVVASAIEKFDALTERARGFQVGRPWQQAQRPTFDDYRATGLREVLAAVSSKRLRAETVASAEPSIAARAGQPTTKAARQSATPASEPGQAMWRAAERRAATLYRHAMDSGEVGGEDPIVDEALERCGSGAQLPLALRKQMEAELGISLARVRVHNDPVAAAAARAVRAEAFTVGEDIFFSENAYAPDSREGKKLLAHELAHVVQAYQGRTPSGAAGISVSQPGESLEREADAMAERIDERFQQPQLRRRKDADAALPTPKAEARRAAPEAAAPRARGSSPEITSAAPAAAPSIAPAASSAGAATLLRRASVPNNESGRDSQGPNARTQDPNKRGTKPKLKLERDRARERTKAALKKGADPVRNGGEKLSADVQNASKSAVNQLKDTAKQVKQNKVGKKAKSLHKDQKKAAKGHKKEAKKLKNHADAHGKKKGKKKGGDSKKVGKLEGDTGPIQFKKIGNWDKLLPDELPDQDKREKKRILKLVQDQVNGERHDSAILLNQLRKANIKAAGEVRGMLPGITGQIRAGQAAAIGRVSSAEAAQAAAVQAATSAQQALVRSSAARMIGQVNSAHTAAMNAIRTAKQDAMTKLTTAKTQSLSDIDAAETLQVTLINLQFSITKMQILALGSAKAGEASARGDSYPFSYDGDKLEAARGAARDVAAEYAKAMPEEASKAYDQVDPEKANCIRDVRKMATDQRKQVNDAFNQCRDTINTAAEGATTAATEMKSGAVSQIQSTSSSTISQLATSGAQAVAGIHSQASSAKAGISKVGAAAIAGVTNGISTAAANLMKQAQGIVQGAKKVETPNVAQTRETVQTGLAALVQAKTGISTSMGKQAQSATTGMNGQAQGAVQGMTQAAAGAKASAQQMGAGAVQGMTAATQGATQGLSQLSESFQKNAETIGKEGKTAMDGVVKGLREAYASATTSLGEGLQGAVDNVKSSFDEVVLPQEDASIAENGKKAADAVKPWWQKALAFVVSIVVAIVVVVVVTALIVTTGPVGAILVGAAAGALGSVLGTMASNLVLGNGIMDGVTWQSIAMGAVGGAIGAGFTQAISAGVGRFGSTALQGMLKTGGGVQGLALRTGVGVAGDMVSDVGTQLLFTGGYQFDMTNFVTSIATNAVSSTGRYDDAQTRFQDGIRARTGHIELGTPGGGIINLSPSAHGRGEGVSTGANTGGRAADVGDGGRTDGGAARTGDGSSARTGDGSSTRTGDGSTARTGDGSTTRTGDGSSTRTGDGSSTRTGDGSSTRTGDGSSTRTGDGSSTRTGDGSSTRTGDGSSTRTGDGSTTRTGDGSTTRTGDGDGSTTRTGDGSTTRAGDGDGSTTRTGDGSTTRTGDGSTTRTGDGPARTGDGDTRTARGGDDQSQTGDRTQTGDRSQTGDRTGGRDGGGGDRDGAPRADDGRHDDGGNHADDGGTPHAGDDAAHGPESAAADALSELGYPNPTREKANAAADAIENGTRPPADTVRDTEANQRGLRELERVDTDPSLTPESRQNIRRDVAEGLRANEPSGDLAHDVSRARAREQARVEAEAARATPRPGDPASAHPADGSVPKPDASTPRPGDGPPAGPDGPRPNQPEAPVAPGSQVAPGVGPDGRPTLDAPNRPPAQAMHPGGLADPTIRKGFEDGVQRLQRDWPHMSSDQRATALKNIINENLRAAGFPEVEVIHFDMSREGNGGHFDKSTWEIAISSAELRPDVHMGGLTDLIIHEARHAEQSYLMARLLVEANPDVTHPGSSNADIAQALHIPEAIVARARAEGPMDAATRSGAYEYYRLMSPDGDRFLERGAWMADLVPSRQGVETARDALIKLGEDPNATPEQIRAAEDALTQARNRNQAAEDWYHNSANEADAYAAGDPGNPITKLDPVNPIRRFMDWVTGKSRRPVVGSDVQLADAALAEARARMANDPSPENASILRQTYHAREQLRLDPTRRTPFQDTGPGSTNQANQQPGDMPAPSSSTTPHPADATARPVEPDSLKALLDSQGKTVESLKGDKNAIKDAARQLLAKKGITSPTESQLTNTAYALHKALESGHADTFQPDVNGSMVKAEDGVNERLGNIFYEKEIFVDSDLTTDRLRMNDSQKARLEGDFESGTAGALKAASFINTSSRSEGDFSHAYGADAWDGFIKADTMLNNIPKGKLLEQLTVDTLLETNRLIHTPDTGLKAKVLRYLAYVGRGFKMDVGGELRTGKQYARPESFTADEIANLHEAGVDTRMFSGSEQKGGKAQLLYPNPAEVRPGLEKIIQKLKTDLEGPNADPIGAAAEFQRKFVALHPFGDSNGRTGRVVMNRILAEYDLPPAILADQNADISLSPAQWRTEVAKGIARSSKFLSERTINPGDKFLADMGITAVANSPNKPITVDGRPFDLGRDGLLYDPNGRPHMVKNGEIIPMSQLENMIFQRRIMQSSESTRPDGTAVSKQDGIQMAGERLTALTSDTRAFYDKLIADPQAGNNVKIKSDSAQRGADAEYKLLPHRETAEMLAMLSDVSMLDPKKIFAISDYSKNGTATSETLSKHQQMDLELWYIEKGIKDAGYKDLLPQVHANRQKLFDMARAELLLHTDPTRVSPENPMGFKFKYEKMMYDTSPLRYPTLDAAIKGMGDGKITVWRGDYSFSKAGMAPNNDLRQPDARGVAKGRSEHNQLTNLIDDLVRLEGNAVGRQYICTTSDLALLAKSSFANMTNSADVNLGSVPGPVKAQLMNFIDKMGNMTPEQRVQAHVDGVKRGDSMVPLANGQNGMEIRDAFGIPGTIVEVRITDKDNAQLNVTAHRKAFQLNVDKSSLLPGIYSLGGPMFVAEQEMHGLQRVWPWQIKKGHESKTLNEEFPVVTGPESTPDGQAPAGGTGGQP